MRTIFFSLIFSLFTLVSLTSSQTSKLPLCVSCNCIFPNNSGPAKVTCDKDVKNVLTSLSAWIDSSEGNQSYPYIEITLTNQNFIELNFTFPASDLTYLNLDNNDIYRITDSVFQNLQKMETLILSNNDLELLSPDAFKGLYMEERLQPLRSLKVLRLDHNKLHSLNMNLFEHSTDLEILDLSYNPLEMIDKHTLIAIDSLPYLRELYLGYTQIKTLPDQMMHTPKYLSILDLSGNPIEKIPDTLAESHNLTTLYLNNTGFTNITKSNGFPDIPTLKVLYMCHLQDLERVEKEALSGLTGLEELHISDNIQLTYIDPFALPKVNDRNGGAIWPLIKRLHLINNKLAYLDSDFLARWDALTELDIRANPWTCECENQWMIEDLMPIYLKIEKEKSLQVRCGAPVEMVDYTFMELYEREYKMRCLDAYGAEPEKDAAMLVGILAGILLAIPIILFGIFAYQRRWFGIMGIFDNSPASYSRRFYSSTKDDDF